MSIDKTKRLFAVLVVGLVWATPYASEEPYSETEATEDFKILAEDVAVSLSPTCAFIAPLNAWEANARSCAVLRQQPLATERLYRLPPGAPSAFLHHRNFSNVPVVLNEDHYVLFSHPLGQDGFIYPLPRKALTPGFWKNWENHFVEGMMAGFVQWVNEDSALFGPGESFGEVTLDNVADLLVVQGRSTSLEKLRMHLLATWLSMEAGYLPLSAQIETQGVPGAEILLGNGPRALHVDPVPARGILRGGVVGTIENLVNAGGLSIRDIETLKNLADGINNGDSAILTGGAVVEPGVIWEGIFGEAQVHSMYARLLNNPTFRQPPGLAATWICTEGMSLAQGVQRRDFTLGGEIMPDPIVDIVSRLRFGIEDFIVIEPRPRGLPLETATPPKSGTDQVRITIGTRIHDISVTYDPSDDVETQFLQFLDVISKQTDLELTTVRYVQDVGHFGNSTRRHAVLTSEKHWELENIETAGTRAWFPSVPSASFPHTVFATYGSPAQALSWLYQETHPLVVVGKTPLLGALPQTVQLKITNLGKLESSPITVTDIVPAGMTATNFSITPSSVTGSVTTGQEITWELPGLPGSFRITQAPQTTIHPDAVITYELSGTINARTLVPGATASWNGEMSRSAEIILEP